MVKTNKKEKLTKNEFAVLCNLMYYDNEKGWKDYKEIKETKNRIKKYIDFKKPLKKQRETDEETNEFIKLLH